MNNSTLGIIIGGLIPALLYGVFAIFTKASILNHLGTSTYLIIVGIACIILGLFSLPIISTNLDRISLRGILFATLAGFCWGGGTLLVNIAISRYKTPISLLTPLYNMNTLVAVLLGLWIFSEWRGISFPTIVLGAILVTIGGIVLSKA